MLLLKQYVVRKSGLLHSRLFQAQIKQNPLEFMVKELKQVCAQMSLSAAVVLTLVSALFFVTNSNRGNAQAHKLLASPEVNRHYYDLRFDPPQIEERNSAQGRCTAIHIPDLSQTYQPGLPTLPVALFSTKVPAGQSYSSHRISNQQSTRYKLDYPLCRTPSYRAEHSFIDPTDRIRKLSQITSSPQEVTLPFPSNQVEKRTLPKVDNKQAELQLTIHPVVLVADDQLHITEQLTLEISYEDALLFPSLKSGRVAAKFSPPTAQSIRVHVRDAGIYAITGAVLDAIPQGTNADDIEVWLRNQQLPREVVMSGGLVNAIHVIVPEVTKSFYNDEAILWIRWTSGSGVNFASEDGDPTLQTAGSSVHAHTDVKQEYNLSWHSLPFDDGTNAEGDPIAPPWDHGYNYWALQYAAAGSPRSADYTFNLDANATLTGSATVKVWLRGMSYYDNVSPDHYVTVSLNGTEIGSLSFDGQAYVNQSFVTTASNLNSGSNTVTLNIPAATVSGYESFAFYGFSITYDRNLVASSDYLDFSLTNAGSYQVSGFSSANLRIFYLENDTTIKELNNVDITLQGDSTYTLDFAANHANARYIAVATDAYKTPVRVVLDSPSTLQDISRGYDYLIIAGSDLISGAQTIANYREYHDGYTTLVIDVQDIFDEYNYGEASAKAIRDFLKEAYNNWQTRPQFLLLVGDSNLDPFGQLNANNANPPLPFFFDRTLYLAIANDSRFAYLTTQGPVPDLAVGRLPVTSNAEIAAYLQKLITTESAAPSESWLKKIQILNDDYNDPTDNWEDSFVQSPQNIINMTATMTAAGAYSVNHINLIETDSTTAKNSLQDQLNDGLFWLYYTGHGAVRGWAAEQILTAATVTNELQPNSPGFPFVSSMTCLTGSFISIYETSLAEAMINADSKGAVGMLASAGMTYPTPQATFAEELFEAFYNNSDLPIGTLIKQTRVLLETQALNDDVVKSYNLFGDPAHKLLPDSQSSAATVTTADTSANLDTDADLDSSDTTTQDNNRTSSTGGCGSIDSAAQGQPLSTLITLLIVLALFLLQRRVVLRP